MKRILSVLSIIAMVLSMFAMIALPTMAAEENPEGNVASPVTNLYIDKAPGYWKNDGTIKSNSVMRSAELIEVAAGDKIYFGPCNIDQGFQLYLWEGAEGFANYTLVKLGNENLTVAARFPGNQVIHCYTVPAAGRIGICAPTSHSDYYCITKNEELTLDVYKAFLKSINCTAAELFEEKVIENNIFKAVEPLGYYVGKDGSITKNNSCTSGELISVKAGDVLYFGPVNLTQNFHLIDWPGSEGYSGYVRLNKADVEKHIVAKFPNGQAILKYEVSRDGRIGIVSATEFDPYFVATKNTYMSLDNYYEYLDRRSNTMGDYSTKLGRYNNVEVKESVLNGKTALFAGDSICAAAADDDFFNEYLYCNDKTATANWGGWAGRVGMFYGLESLNNQGISGAALSTTRDTWYDTSSTGRKQGRIYWQITRNAAYHYDYVVLHGGVNDAWDSAPAGKISDSFDIEDFDLDTYAGGLEATFYYATKYHPEAAIGYILNFEAPLKKTGNIPNMGKIYFELGKQICEKWGISYLDLYSILNAETFDTALYTRDYIHPNAAGYNIIGEYVAKWMETLTPYSEHKVQEHDKTVIACIGDSLTMGSQCDDLNRESYPAYLQEMLGDEYDVWNLGHGGAAAQTDSENAYKSTFQYKKSLELDPDQVIVMLGANDARTDNGNWDTSDHVASCAKYKAHLKALVEEYMNLPSKPTVTLVVPPYTSRTTYNSTYNNGGLLNAVKEIAAELEINLVDAYTPTSAHPEYLVDDGVHFTGAGYKIIAEAIYKGITGKTAPVLTPVTEKDTAVEETNPAKPLIRNWKEYYETVDAFRIETIEDVEIFGDLIYAGYTFAGKTVYLENDLDFSGKDFTPLGASTGQSDIPTKEQCTNVFQGTFDGQNHVFSNIVIDYNWYQIGVFPVTCGAVIKNFGLDGGSINGHSYIGSIVGVGVESTSLYNVWSSMDVFASYRSAGSVGGIVGVLYGEASVLDTVAYYGTVSGISKIGGICGYSELNTAVKDVYFGGTLDMRYKHNTVTPLIRYSSDAVTGASSDLYVAEGTEIRTTYANTATPVEIAKDAATNGEFSVFMNEKGKAPVWTMKYGYAVPFADENNAAPVSIIKDSVTYYTDYAGKPIGFDLEDGSYWYLNGVLTALADMPETFNEGDVLTIAVSAAGADFDADGAITTADVIMLLRYVDHKDETITEAQADVNADGKIVVYDAVRLLQVIRDIVEI